MQLFGFIVFGGLEKKPNVLIFHGMEKHGLVYKNLRHAAHNIRQALLLKPEDDENQV